MVVTNQVKAVVGRSEQAICFEKGWIMRDSLVQQISGLQQVRFRIPARESIGSSIEIKGRDVICGGLLHLGLFACRKPGLQLAGNRCGDLTLNREYTGKGTVVSLRPELTTGGYIEQMGVNPPPIFCSLNASFHHMRDTEFVPDLVEISCRSTLILHRRSAAGHFQISEARQPG